MTDDAEVTLTDSVEIVLTDSAEIVLTDSDRLTTKTRKSRNDTLIGDKNINIVDKSNIIR